MNYKKPIPVDVPMGNPQGNQGPKRNLDQDITIPTEEQNAHKALPPVIQAPIPSQKRVFSSRWHV